MSLKNNASSPRRFENKIALVTGGANGIGRAICRRLASEGARVAIADLDRERGRELANSLPGALYLETDVSDEQNVREMARQVASNYGKLHVLVNNAGIGMRCSVYDETSEAWHKVLATNLTGAFYCSSHCAPLIRDSGGGAIINIASTRALMSEQDTLSYSASKGGLLALTHSLAISLGKDLIRVNAISPGWINVSPGAELSETDHKQHPVGRVGVPEDVAAACAFLASDEAGFITGQNLIVDGGMTVKMIYV